ncbi:MAG: oligosaccharide flippase family protein [bacterium]|nr:oligosaccharide flippase family protein [bacterium]
MLKKFLIWSQKYTHLDMIYFTTGGFWLVTAQLVSLIASLALSIVFARYLSKEVYGNYSFLQTAFSLLTVFSLPGINTAILQAVAAGDDSAVPKAIRTRIKWGLIGSFAAFGMSVFYFVTGNPTLSLGFVILGVFISILNPSSVYDAILQGKKAFALNTKFFIISQIVSSFFLVTSIIITNNLFVILLTYFSINSLFNLVFLKITLGKLKITKDSDDNKVVLYGKQLSALNIINTIAGYLDKILVFHFLGAASLSVYTFAIAPPEQIKAIFGSLHILTFPKFAERPVEEIKRDVSAHILKIAAIAVVCVGGYILAAPTIYKLFFPNYLAAVSYSQVFSLSLLNLVLYPAATYMLAKKKIRQQYTVEICTSILQIISMYFFIIWWGLWGLVLSRVLIRFFGAGFYAILFYRETVPSKSIGNL